MIRHKLKWNWCLKVTENGLYSDGGNLYLQVRNDGAAKSWIFRYVDPRTKKDTLMGLGSIHAVDLNKARVRAGTYSEQLEEGKDPKAERDGAKLDAAIAAGRAKTMDEVYEEFCAAKLVHTATSSQYYATRTIKNHLLDKIVGGRRVGDMPIAKVDQGVANAVLSEEFWRTMNPTAIQLHSYAKRLFSFAIQKAYYTGKNPFAWVDNLQHALVPSKVVHTKKHRASLPYKDLPQFMEAVSSYQDRSSRHHGHPNIALCLKFVVLSGVRSSEPRLAQWKEFDFATMVWAVPPEHHKIGRLTRLPHYLPITPQMLTVLEEMQRRRLDPSPDAFVFFSPYRVYRAVGRRGIKGQSFAQHPSSRGALGNEPPRNGTSKPFGRPALLAFVRGSLKCDVNITPHGFRSTLRDWCRAQGSKYPKEWWDLQVGHLLGSGNETDQAYGPDTLVEERRVMMTEYGRYCSAPAPEPASADVVEFTDRRKRA
jgi:integrase